MDPFRTGPIYVPKVWAGTRLGDFGLQPPPPPKTGEAWLVSDLPAAASPVLDGPHAGRTLTDLVRDHPVELLGAGRENDERFPLLVKLLDIGRPLSVQVHPDAAVAKALGDGDRGKCEAWLVLSAEDDGAVYLGLDEGVDPGEVPRLAANGTLPDHMRRFRPEAGEGIEIVPGSLHTAEGILILEAQEAADITYRVYDYGRGRPLHLAQASRCLEIAAVTQRGAGGWAPGRRLLSPRSPFCFEAVELAAGEEALLEEACARVLVPLQGRLRVGDVAASPGQSVVIPAACGPVRLVALEGCRAGYAADTQGNR